jgi:LysM repeat protein
VIGAVGLVACVGCLAVLLLRRMGGVNLPLASGPSATPQPSPVASASLLPPAVFTPEQSPTVTSAFSPTPTERVAFQYTVVEGDSLYSIALENGLSVEQLAAANGKVNDSLAIGEVLVIPEPEYQPPTATPFPTDLAPNTAIEHVVKPGETLAGIAAAYLTTVESIVDENPDVVIDPAVAPVGSTIVVRFGLITPTPVVAPTTGPSQAPSATATLSG